jgi:hypothetical protein
MRKVALDVGHRPIPGSGTLSDRGGLATSFDRAAQVARYVLSVAGDVQPGRRGARPAACRDLEPRLMSLRPPTQSRQQPGTFCRQETPQPSTVLDTN